MAERFDGLPNVGLQFGISFVNHLKRVYIQGYSVAIIGGICMIKGKTLFGRL